MRILHVSTYYFPWIGYQEFYLAREQVRSGHDVLVATSNYRWPADAALGYAALKESGKSREMPVGPATEYGISTVRHRVSLSLKGRLFMAGLGETIRQFRPHAIHAHGFLLPSTFQVAFARRRQDFRLVVDEHQLPHQAVSGRLHRIQRYSVAALGRALILPVTDALVAVADGARDWLVQAYHCPGDRVQTIPLGADIEMFRPDALSGQSIRKDLALDLSSRLILYSGKIAATKRIDVLVRAVASLPSRLKTTLLLVGPANDEALASLQQTATENGVQLIVKPAVPPQELAHYFNAADVCAWPADCTISHLEAAACGKPIIIPGEPGIQDRISAGNGLPVAVGDVAALANALELILSNDVLRNKMGEAGRQLVVDRYSWGAISQQFIKLYGGEHAAHVTG